MIEAQTLVSSSSEILTPQSLSRNDQAFDNLSRYSSASKENALETSTPLDPAVEMVSAAVARTKHEVITPCSIES